MFSALLALVAIPAVLGAPSFSFGDNSNHLSKRCVNSAEDRSCWGDYDISTNYYDVVPDTGVVREYWFNVENITAAPDGRERVVLAINGSVPGPTIIADWGDEVVVHVTNSLTNNGSSIHWHGIRQNYTNEMDGVPSITQCPIAPGDTQTYRWRATQYGSSWYHSHFSLQAWDGVFGGILINGPATANYDEDLGHIFMNDWSLATADQLGLSAAVNGPPTSENCLINGTNTYTMDDGSVVGERFETSFEAGKKYRIRLVNGAADTHFRFTIDNHTLEVIASDFVPIVPYNTTSVSIGMGQRYDVIVTATESTGNFWLRAIPQESCSDNDNVDNILGIVRYDSTSTDEPSTTVYDLDDSCADEDASNLVPYLSMDVGVASDEDDELASLSFGTKIKWTMNAVSFVSEWNYPTVKAIAESNTTWDSAEHVWTMPNANEWVLMVINTDFGQAHPIHLHGHDFWVLGAGDGTYDNTTDTLTTVNAPRRDTAMLPADGWLALAWITDNPGAWIMHCKRYLFCTHTPWWDYITNNSFLP